MVMLLTKLKYLENPKHLGLNNIRLLIELADHALQRSKTNGNLLAHLNDYKMLHLLSPRNGYMEHNNICKV